MRDTEKKIIVNLMAILFVIGFAISISTAMRAAYLEHRQIGSIIWVLLFITIIMIVGAAWVLSKILFLQRRVGKKLFDICVYNFKTFRILLIAFALINIYQIVTMILEPGYMGVLLELIMFSMILIVIFLFILGNGIFEKGIILSGQLYIWYNVRAFKIDGDNLEITVNLKTLSEAKPSIVKLRLKVKKQDSDPIKAYLERRLLAEQ